DHAPQVQPSRQEHASGHDRRELPVGDDGLDAERGEQWNLLRPRAYSPAAIASPARRAVLPHKPGALPASDAVRQLLYLTWPRSGKLSNSVVIVRPDCV